MRELSIKTYFGNDGLLAIASCVENVETLCFEDYTDDITTQGNQALAKAIKKRKHKVKFYQKKYSQNTVEHIIY